VRADWDTKPLREICEIKPSKSEAKRRLKGSDPVSFVPMEDLGIGEKFLEPNAERELRAVAGSYTYFADGDVLLAKITPCFENGKLGIARNLINGIGFGSSEYIVFRPSAGLSSEYLYYFLLQDSFRAEGRKTMSGAVGHKRVSKEFIERYQIPLPPFPEQQRIVAILDEAFAGLATANANAEKNLKNARELFASYRESVFEARGEEWIECTLDQLVEIKHGFAFKSEYFTSEGDYVLLTPGNFFEEGGYRDRGNKQKYYVGEIPDGFISKKGDFLIAMTEQASGLLGSSIIVPEDNRFLHNQRLGLVQLKPGTQWSNEFFCHAFNTRHFRQAAHDSASGVKVRHTSPTKLGEILVSFPKSREEQDKVARQLDDLLDETTRLGEKYELRLSQISELKQSILQKAFSGELTSPPSQAIKEAAE
jgi:type I restriction enzyme S subunit